jgi:hypothetical protein
VEDVKMGYKQSVLKLYAGGEYQDRKSLLAAWYGDKGERLRVAGLAGMTSGKERCHQLMGGLAKPTNLIEMALYKLTKQWTEDDEYVFKRIIPLTAAEVERAEIAGNNPEKVQLFKLTYWWKQQQEDQGVEEVDAPENAQDNPIQANQGQQDCKPQQGRASSSDSHVSANAKECKIADNGPKGPEPELSATRGRSSSDLSIEWGGLPPETGMDPGSILQRPMSKKDMKREVGARKKELRKRKEAAISASIDAVEQAMSNCIKRAYREAKGEPRRVHDG